ncbi:hypothetical protein BD1_48 [Octadecabacter Antarctic BD virus 1]|nr:hypothetical protein BD1_48 [Octadecabacter Antarctic BD virus 1]
MTRMRYKNTIAALPPEVVRQIWFEVNEGRVPERVEYAGIAGRPTGANGGRRSNGLLTAFVVAAIDHPNYANPTDIAAALDVSVERTREAANRAITAARRNRLTTGT